MSDDLEAYVRSPGPLPEADFTSLAHRALGEVLTLAPEVVQPLEARIESDYQTARQRATARFEREKEKIEGDFQAQSAEIKDQRDALVEDIQADYEDQLSTTKVEAQHKRNKVNQKAADLESAAEKERQERLMEADFVAEGAATRAEQKRLEAESAVETARQYLQDLNAAAERLLAQYRQPAAARDGQAEAGDATYENPAEICRAQQARSEQLLEKLQKSYTAQLFVGARPFLLVGGLLFTAMIVLACLYIFAGGDLPPASVTVPVTMGAVLVLAALAGHVLWRSAKSRVRRTFDAFGEALTATRAALEQNHQQVLQHIEEELRTAQKTKEAELQKARDTFRQTKANIVAQRGKSLAEIEQQRKDILDRLKQQRDEALHKAEHKYQQEQSELQRQREEDLTRIQERFDAETSAADSAYRTSRQRLERRWDEALAAVEALLGRTATFDERVAKDLSQLLVESWTPPTTLAAAVRFGTFELDLRRIAETVLSRAGSALDPARPAVVPALLEFPERCAVLLQSERQGRQQAIETLRAVMMRLFTSLPPGEVRFTILDPVGLGESF
ncbi:MAG: hypothetical protein JW741_05875, partial [Sedimentisphaerales bacterium]|nr:hypothetical protein [Sedimentisphaerales bacterium]